MPKHSRTLTARSTPFSNICLTFTAIYGDCNTPNKFLDVTNKDAKEVMWHSSWSLSIINLEQLIFTWKGRHLVLVLVASRQMIVVLSLCYPYCVFIRDATYCFFLHFSVVDDYYILYTLVHQNFDISLVSRDMFRDHLYHLDAQNTADFKRWQRSNQFLIKTFQKDGKPIFKVWKSSILKFTDFNLFVNYSIFVTLH